MTHLDNDAPGDELDDGRVADLFARLTAADHERHDPPADLWAGIAARVAGAAPDRRPVVISARERRFPSRGLLAAAAAVVILAGGTGAYFVSRDGTHIDPPPTERLLASAELEQLEPLGTTKASARLVTLAGTTHLLIDATDMASPPPGSDYELWLIDPEVTDPRSLGTVTGSGDIIVPPSIDPTAYPIVDISLEPKDGDHQHSGHSLMRGTLR